MLKDRRADLQHRLGRSRRRRRTQPLQDADQPLGLRLQYMGDQAMRLGLAESAAGQSLLGQEAGDIVSPKRCPVGVTEPTGDSRRAPLVGRAPTVQILAGAAQAGMIEDAVAAGLPQNVRRGFPGLEPQTAPHARNQQPDAAMIGDGLRQPAPRREHRLDQRTEPALVHIFDQHRQGAAQRLFRRAAGADQHLLPRLTQQLGGGPVIQQVEMRRQPGFERKTPQNRLAKSVNGLDTETGGRIDDGGEQLPRARLHVGVGLPAVQVEQRLFQRRVIHHRPFAQPLDDAVGHFGGGGPGEGDAEDTVGRRAAEQQAQHAVGQHGRLAGAGRRIDPDAGVGRGGAVAALAFGGNRHDPSVHS